MMLTGFIKRGRGAGPGWVTSCGVIGVHTQGTSRKNAAEMLADAIESVAHRDGFKVRVSETGRVTDGEHEVIVDSVQPEVLAAIVLRYQREAHKLTLEQVTKRMGMSSISSYAAYEQGTREPSLSKFRALLAAVAPELVLGLVPRNAFDANDDATDQKKKLKHIVANRPSEARERRSATLQRSMPVKNRKRAAG